MNITEPVQRHARLLPDAVAAIADGREISYAELDRLIDAAAARMTQAGVRPGAAVAVLVAHRFRHLVLTLALARQGIAAVLSSHIAAHPGSLRIQARLVDAGAAAAGAKDSIAVDDAWWHGLAGTMPVASVPGRDAAAACLVGASSGTTGTPKGIVLDQARLARRLHGRALSILWPARPRVACSLGRESTYGFTSLMRALWAGGLVAFPGASASLADFIREHRLDCLVMSPAQLQQMVDALPEDAASLPSLEVVELGGGMLPARLASSARARLCPNIHVNYGAQEAGSVASAPMTLLEKYPGSVGFVSPGVEVQVVDAERRPVAAGVEGSIRVRSPVCIEGYLDDPASTARAFADGWFYPGDTGALSATGLLVLSGRSDELLNAGGVKVSPDIIEEVARAQPEVADAAAFAAPDPKSGLPQIWLAIVQRKPVDMQALIKHCVRELGRARSPRAVLLLESLPRNENGKLQRDRLVKMV